MALDEGLREQTFHVQHSTDARNGVFSHSKGGVWLVIEDIENEVFAAVKAAVKAGYPAAYVSGEPVKVPPSFPAVSLIEMDNSVYERAQTLSSIENMVTLMYEFNAFSNIKSGKKSECKAIVALIDTAMQSFGFRRIMLNPIQNLEDATIYRMVGRYQKLHS